MPQEPPPCSGFVSPLNDKQHAQLGRIAVLWGQIEAVIDFVLPTFCDLSHQELNAIQVFSRPMAAKAAFLKQVSKSRAAESVHEKVMTFLEIIENTKVDRNHAFHSMWGWRINEKKMTVEPCARYLTQPDKNLRPHQLPRLERELTKCAQIGKELLHIALGTGPNYEPSRFFHGAPNDPPPWLEQWLEQNPLNLQSLDCGPKKDQLPRLIDDHQQR